MPTFVKISVLALFMSPFLIAIGAIQAKRQGVCTCSSLTQLQKAIDSLQAEADKLKKKCVSVPIKPAEPEGPCGKDVIAYYPFDRSFRDVCYGNNGVKEGGVSLGPYSSGVLNGAAIFSGNGRVRVARLNGYAWGSQFSVSLWFKRTGSKGTYQGLASNGYYSYGSWEIRMGREFSGQMLGGGVVTKDSSSTWDYAQLKATFDHWHHVVMTYNGNTLDFYLDNVKQKGKSSCCHGDMLTKNTDVVIGQAGHGTKTEYFVGKIDEVKLFKKALSAQDVQKLYQLKNV